ncbi:hypothetical protein CYMTET_10258 [Cymbomonas tetramitiformis]|uniref:Uncharacterized protein n=1 Tax=Cymbomonas tetramitiformis TaxID=36881 RepID=A0AAE0GPN4_9CHLO|nr:hypothetical protein CYMTET_10258 [Cymbomonas tetramitiformis]
MRDCRRRWRRRCVLADMRASGSRDPALDTTDREAAHVGGRLAVGQEFLQRTVFPLRLDPEGTRRNAVEHLRLAPRQKAERSEPLAVVLVHGRLKLLRQQVVLDVTEGEAVEASPSAVLDVCLTEVEGGAPPAAAAFRRFGVPRGSRPFGFGEFALTLFMVATFLFSATAMPTLVVGGGVRGLVEPGATYGYDAVHPGGTLLDSFCPSVIATGSSMPPRDVGPFFSQSTSAALQFEILATPLWDPPDPLGSGGVNAYKFSSQLTSDAFLEWDPYAELGSADQLCSG